jgi:tRNA threonylcarbamoyladenosine biosynthesis protein TsaE
LATSHIVKNLIWRTESDTAMCAQRLATRPEIGHAVIELHGDLGAGKTTWVRHLLRALHVSGRIKSPTYGLVEPHTGECQGQPLNIWHFDFYRLQDPREWHEAGLRDVFIQPGLKVIEWPQQAGDDRPAADVVLRIESLDNEERHVQATGHSEIGLALVGAM